MQFGSKSAVYLEPVEIDMTPMIDCVFLLIIFFMIVVDMTQAEIVLLQLPKAEFAIPDKSPEKNRLTVNVTWDKEHSVAEIRIKRTVYTLDELKAWMFPIARSKVDPKTKFSEIPILIRCDQDAPFKVVQQIMALCADKDIQIYKVLLAAAEVEKEGDSVFKP